MICSACFLSKTFLIVKSEFVSLWEATRSFFVKFTPVLFVEGCVSHIFASFFCMSKREHLWNKKKSFLFHFKSSFCSWDNQILAWDIHISWRHQMPKHKTRNTFYWITWEVNTVWWWNLASLHNITKENFLWKISVKNVA